MTGCKCNSFGSTQDSGIIRTRDLPIKTFSYGPLSTVEGNEIKVQIGDLKCSGTSPPITECKLAMIILIFLYTVHHFFVSKIQLVTATKSNKVANPFLVFIHSRLIQKQLMHIAK